MIRYHRVILSTFLVICVLCCTGARSLGQAFKWEVVKHKGAEYVTLRSIQSFYYFKSIKYGSKITLESSKVKMEVSKGSQRCRLNGVLFILSHPIIQSGGRYLMSRTDLVKLVDPVMRPTYIKNARPFTTVVVDAGHGGKDPGSRGFFLNEKEYALKMARLVRDKLQAKGYRVVMTRDSDVFISLSNRVRIANKYPGAVFVSIHFNSGNARANGIETFTISPVGVPHMGRGVKARDFNMVPGNIMDSASIALATAVHSRALLYLNDATYGNNFRIEDRGIKRARFNVLTGIRIPAILFEGGFLSNRAEAGKVHSGAYRETLANALVRAIDVYRGSVSRGR
ncbi:MAG: N-acetylmuramoyl-L-alanine amidase [Verrucomicrobiae bacterium]|nr:N-acetylmuramoyl-L-alanine amidase [Verrucomicrobiae bacterium]NNJ44121.1 N-acetylmuramoyl-L-alanine amidase [Akkermansiaceae bacterium]